MISFKEYDALILESYKDAKRIFLMQLNNNRDSWGESEMTMDEFTPKFDILIQEFKRLQTANILSGQEKDISYWIGKGYNDFIRMLHAKKKELNHKAREKAKSKDAVVAFQNENATVYNIKSYEASCKYGANTKWCITSADTREHWDSYTKQGINFYFIIIDKDYTWGDGWPQHKKIAVAVMPMYSDVPYEVYDVMDSMITMSTFEAILDELHIPDEIFIAKQLTDEETMRNQLYIARMPDNLPNTMANHEKWESMWNVQAARSYALNFNGTYHRLKRFIEKSVVEFSDDYYMIMFWNDGSSLVASLDDDGDQPEYVYKNLEEFWDYMNRYEITPQQSLIDAMEYASKKLGRENKWSRVIGEKENPLKTWEDAGVTINYFKDKRVEVEYHSAFDDETVEYEHYSRFVAEYDDMDYNSQSKAIRDALDYFTK
jgi:hypothetical protein